MLILASASPRRLQLLKMIGVTPDLILPADIDETPLKRERPRAYVKRVARGKAAVIAPQHPGAMVISADTVVACGFTILPKAEDEETARHCLDMLSGRQHHVFTHVCVAHEGKMREKTVQTIVRFSTLSLHEIEAYIATEEWNGKAGGYAIQGHAAAFIPHIIGSHSNVVGLPLYETAQLIRA